MHVQTHEVARALTASGKRFRATMTIAVNLNQRAARAAAHNLRRGFRAEGGPVVAGMVPAASGFAVATSGRGGCVPSCGESGAG